MFRAISLLLVWCQGAHTAAWCLKPICFVWHKICCMTLQKHWFLQSVQFSEVTSICPSYFAFFLLVTLHHFSEWFQVVEITQTESTLAVFLYMIQVCQHGFSPSGCFHCSFSCIPLEGLCAYYCLRRTYAYLPVASWCLFHFPDNWWIWNTRRFCNSVFFTRSLKVYSCISFFLFLVYFKNL